MTSNAEIWDDLFYAESDVAPVEHLDGTYLNGRPMALRDAERAGVDADLHEALSHTLRDSGVAETCFECGKVVAVVYFDKCIWMSVGAAGHMDQTRQWFLVDRLKDPVSSPYDDYEEHFPRPTSITRFEGPGYVHHQTCPECGATQQPMKLIKHYRRAWETLTEIAQDSDSLWNAWAAGAPMPNGPESLVPAPVKPSFRLARP